jgi:hypothetical protein
MKKMLGIFWLVLLLLGGFVQVKAQERTVGLFLNDSTSFNGYTLFTPMPDTATYLIDNNGLLVHSWESNFQPSLSVYLLENGHLLRTASESNPPFPNEGGRVQEFDWDGTVIWEFSYASNLYFRHHDIEPLPNGNVLMIAWEYKTYEEAIDAGRDPSLLNQGYLIPDHIIEVEPVGDTSGNIVWEWHAWDHLIQDYDSTKTNYGVVSDQPELIDINHVNRAKAADHIHLNGIDYNDSLDQIVVSSVPFNEVWVIDHSTTTEEARGHTGGNSGKGGDLLYRWGNPQTYRAGDASDQKLFRPHDAHWIEYGNPGGGNILVFNNGANRPDGNYSSVDEIVPPVDENGSYELTPDSSYGPEEPVWSYTAVNPADFYSPGISGAQRLPNGNTLICEGQKGNFFEVTPEQEIIWKYVNPVIQSGPLTQGYCIPTAGDSQQNRVFKIRRYAPDYPGLAGRDLTPGDHIELYPAVYRGDANGDEEVSLSDIVYLIFYLFKGGHSPDPLHIGDSNDDGQVSLSDIVFLIVYLFKDGPPPECIPL